MAVAAQQDMRPWPIGADSAQQAAQECFDLLAAGPFGRTQHRSDETALSIKNNNRLKTVFIIMGIEKPQLLAAMNRVEGVVDVERMRFGICRNDSQ